MKSPYVRAIIIVASLVLFFIGLTLTIGQPSLVFAQNTGGHSDCLSCHSNPKLMGQFLDGEIISLYFEFNSHSKSTHTMRCEACHDKQQNYPHESSMENSCSLCHWQNTMQAEEPQQMVFDLPYQDERAMSLEISSSCKKCHAEKIKESGDSLHLKTMREGNRYAPVCVDCHRGHDIAPGELTRTAIPVICSTCHLSVFTSYKSSVHGSALENNENMDVPTCGDCHGTHVVKGPDQVNFRVDSIAVCGECHGDQTLMNKYGLSVDVFDTYLNDFHGRTVEYSRRSGTLEVDKATCYDCHGVHNILSPEDPSSTVYPANIQGTCQKCHPDAGMTFPQAWLSHDTPNWDTSPVLFVIDSIYKVLIPIVVGGCAIYIAIDVRRLIIDRSQNGRTNNNL